MVNMRSSCYICGKVVEARGLCSIHYYRCMRAKIDIKDKKTVKKYIKKRYEITNKIRKDHGRYIVIDHNEERLTGKTRILYSCYNLTEAKIAYNKAMEILYGANNFEMFNIRLNKDKYEEIKKDIVLMLKPRETPSCMQGIKSKKYKSSSKYVGVSLKNEKCRKLVYVANIRYKEKTIFLGHFPHTPEGEVLAAAAYNEAALTIYGENALLNPIKMPIESVINQEKLIEKLKL